MAGAGHNTVNVNPVFVQFFDINNQLIDKSPNLKGLQLQMYPTALDNKFIDTYLNKNQSGKFKCLFWTKIK